jgi:mRNA-binding protein PUF3
MNPLDGQGYQSPQQASAYSDFAPNAFGARNLQANVAAEFGQRQHFVNGALPPQLLELPSGPRSNASWNPMPNGASIMDGRFPDQQEQSTYADLRMHQQMLGQLRNSFPAVYSPYGMHPAFPINGTNGYIPVVTMNGSPVNATGEVGDMGPHTGEHMQSFLMMDFKANAKSKHFQLKDIYDHIAEFSGDQHGSRFIQTKLESANSDEKERVFKEIEPNAIQLMTDVFGNYVIQKFFEHGDQRHKKILAHKMKGEVLTLSLQMYGCRVVQKALDHVLVDQQHELVSELEGQVLKCVKDQNGNHVIQKTIERCPPATVGFIIQAFRGEVQHLSIHPYGCRVIQRCLERCEPGPKAMIMDELMGCIDQLIADQYGNYVVQHVVQHDEGRGKDLVLNIVGRGLETYSKHKFASNVVEKCLEKSSDEWRRQVVWALANGHPQRGEGEGVFVSMIKDSYGNYVIRKYRSHTCRRTATNMF